MRCMNCGADMRKTNESMTEEYKGYSITVSGIEHYVCDACGECEIDASHIDQYSNSILKEYVRICGLLAPEEIQVARTGLEMTQSQFGKLIGVSASLVAQWEKGAVAPSKSVCKLIRMYEQHPELIHQEKVSVAKRLHLPQGWKVISGGSNNSDKPPVYKSAPQRSHVQVSSYELKEG